MKTKYFKTTSFWAREFRLPIFFQVIINKGYKTIAFYKNSIIHAYYLDNQEKKLSDIGYKFFTNNQEVIGYQKKVNDILKEIKKTTKEYDNLNIQKINNNELKDRFVNVLNFLNEYSKIYLKTESACLLKIEENSKKSKNLIKKLGKLRFKLRKEGEPIFYIILGVISKEISRRFNLKVSDLFFYNYDEILKLFSRKKVRREIVERRKKGYALVTLGNKSIIITGERFKKLFREIVIQKQNIREIVGQIAMKGRVKGKVQVILHNKRNIAKEVIGFKKGEILVTEMTRPDTILACKKAAAIVTDEGGVTSHAAIISRELKIPCVIATKIATQILKEGDLVEVDAYKGVVKILKRKK